MAGRLMRGVVAGVLLVSVGATALAAAGQEADRALKSFGGCRGVCVLIGDKEHNSNLIPWQMLAKRRGIVVKIVPFRPDNTFDLAAFEKLLDGQVRLVSLGYTSNLDGVTIPVEEVIRLAHRAGVNQNTQEMPSGIPVCSAIGLNTAVCGCTG